MPSVDCGQDTTTLWIKWPSIGSPALVGSTGSGLPLLDGWTYQDNALQIPRPRTRRRTPYQFQYSNSSILSFDTHQRSLYTHDIVYIAMLSNTIVLPAGLVSRDSGAICGTSRDILYRLA